MLIWTRPYVRYSQANLRRQIKTVHLQLYAPLRNKAEILAKEGNVLQGPTPTVIVQLQLVSTLYTGLSI